jgi:hypothetical protein
VVALDLAGLAEDLAEDLEEDPDLEDVALLDLLETCPRRTALLKTLWRIPRPQRRPKSW